MAAGQGAPPVGRVARAWRLAAVAGVVGALVYGSARGGDDLFPFSPMTQYAFRVDPDGEIHAVWLEAEDATGRRFRVDISNSGDVGIARAELEGQFERIVADPSRLQVLVDAWAGLHPDRPALTGLVMGTDVISLHNGHETGRRADISATWTVPGGEP